MSYYVRIKAMSGRQDHVTLGTWLNESGVKEVEYFQGGWDDYSIDGIAPHLKFDNEEDAIAFSLKFGIRYTDKVPHKARIDIKIV